ncbi:TetR/AcrR family transcriptional regulator, partial [Deinococcus sp.]|uniref:TetR/AcrR family transcriptional regulator n=1 Tax=Deinococcus sp. TaxID=47478 RepID=UPI0028699376
EQLLATAQTLFIERGFEGVGMNDIARALGTSRPTVYTYFTSTEAMLRTLLDARLPALWQRLRPLLEAAQHTPTSTPLDFRAIFGALLQERELLLLMHSGGGPTFREQRRHFLTELAALLAPYRPIQAGHGGPHGALHIVTLLLEAVAVESLRYPEGVPDGLDDTLAAFIAGGLGALRGEAEPVGGR